MPHDAAQGRYVNPTNACQSFRPHPSTFAFSGFEGAKRHRLCRPSGNPLGLNPAGVLLFRMRAHQMENAPWKAGRSVGTSHPSVHRPPPRACCRFARVLPGDAGGCDVPLEWLVPHDAAQGRYVNPTNACQSFQPHPSTFAFSGFEGAKRHRLCRPSGNPLGLNPAGVLLFRMRAHQMENAPWKAGRSVGTSHPSVHRPPPRACCRFARVLPGDAGGCDVPLEWLVPHDAAQGRYVNPTNACQSFQPHPSTFAFSGFEGAKRHRLCRPSGNPLGLNPADVPLEWLVPHDAAQGRYVNPTNACQSFQPHPSTFAFSGFEGAKRHRLCRPSGNPLGLNPAGVLLFRMRAHQMENAPWKAGRSVGTSHPSVHRPPPRACCRFARVLPGDAGGCDVPLEWLVPHDAAQGRYVNPTNACQSFQPHPSTFAFSGFEGAKRHRLCRPSGNPLGLNPADVPLEWLVPHDAAQGRYVNPTNACQSFQPHPSTFAFSGFEGAKRHRLCRPSGNPLGLNPAGVLLFRMRAHQMENAPWKAGRSVGTSHPSVHRPPPRACCRFARVLPGDAGGCDVPLEWLVPHDAAHGRYVNPTNACQSFQPHPSAFAFSGFEGAKRHRLCRPSGNPLGLNPADVPLEWLVPHDAAQGRYVNPTNACQSFQPHPSTFAFSGFEGAKRHRLCRPSGNPLGLNPAGVLLFRMRAHQIENAPWKAGRSVGTSHPSVHRPPPRACCRFARVLPGDAGGCDVPLEWLVPHDAAQGRYVNPTNACQSFQPHPSAFAFSGFEGAKRHRLCRPSGNPLGLNPAGVLLFRMRAHRRGWRL